MTDIDIFRYASLFISSICFNFDKSPEWIGNQQDKYRGLLVFEIKLRQNFRAKIVAFYHTFYDLCLLLYGPPLIYLKRIVTQMGTNCCYFNQINEHFI